MLISEEKREGKKMNGKQLNELSKERNREIIEEKDRV